MAAAERSDYTTPAGTAHSRHADVHHVSDEFDLEKVRRLTEAGCSSIIATSIDAIVSVDEAQRIILFNRGAEETFGYEAADVIGKPLDILIPEDMREAHREHVRKFAGSGQRARRMTRHRGVKGLRANGEIFEADASISVIEVDGEKIYTAALRDISAEVRTASLRQFLSDASHTLAEVIEFDDVLRKITGIVLPRMADYVVIDLLDFEGRVSRPIAVHRDPDQQHLLDELRRYPPADQQSGPARVLRSGLPDVVPVVDPAWLRAIARDEDHYRLLRRLGPRSVISLPLRARAHLIGAITCAIVTAERRYDAELLHFAEILAARAALSIDNASLYRELREAVRTRDEVLRIVAHDLRNPLNTIGLTVGVLAETMPPEMAEHCGPKLDVIQRSTERANLLIGDLLDAARIREGKLTLERRPIETAPLVEDAISLQQAQAEERHLHLEYDLPSGLPAIDADHHRILQVFGNLIGNALKFTPEGGRITVRAVPEDGEVHFSVVDTGRGIQPRAIARLFDPFWQGPDAPGGGTGLGLAICKGIVTAHGGRIWVESEVGVGTTVHFTIPTARSTS